MDRGEARARIGEAGGRRIRAVGVRAAGVRAAGGCGAGRPGAAGGGPGPAGPTGTGHPYVAGPGRAQAPAGTATPTVGAAAAAGAGGDGAAHPTAASRRPDLRGLRRGQPTDSTVLQPVWRLVADRRRGTHPVVAQDPAVLSTAPGAPGGRPTEATPKVADPARAHRSVPPRTARRGAARRAALRHLPLDAWCGERAGAGGQGMGGVRDLAESRRGSTDIHRGHRAAPRSCRRTGHGPGQQHLLGGTGCGSAAHARAAIRPPDPPGARHRRQRCIRRRIPGAGAAEGSAHGVFRR